jgi:LmbE family N-acetylglucosaminyl deacetylase
MKITIPFKGSDRRTHSLLPFVIAAACLLASFPGNSRAAESLPAAAILQDLRGFRELGSVLLVGAHPDDENTQLIAYLARGRNYRTAYLSLTRGDGGQNVLGPEFDEELGVIRTQELLAARRIDGGRQFFTRAIDFGFSKSAEETLTIWNRDQVLADVVRVIRTFRPDVVITRPPTTGGGGGHGHHTAASILAVEAYKLAGDPKAFPEQLGGELTLWQPRRLLLSVGGFGRGGGGGSNTNALRIEVDGTDPVSGESFSTIAGRSRSMHKSQGFGAFGGGRGGGPRSESFQVSDDGPAIKDILDGVDTTWGRVPGGTEIGRLTEEVIAKFNPQDPAASVPALLTIRSRLAALPADRVVDEKRRQLDRIVQACLGLSVETVVPQAEVVPGEIVKLHHTAVITSDIPVRWVGTRHPAIKEEFTSTSAVKLTPNQPSSRDETITLPPTTPLSQPYWLREDHATGMFRVDDPTLIGQPENPPAFPVEQVFEVGGQTLVIPDEPVRLIHNAAKGDIRRRLDVIPPVSLKPEYDIRLFAPGAARPVEVEVTAYRADTAGTLRLDAPNGWKITPATQSFSLKAIGNNEKFSFTVTAPPDPASASITARAEIKGVRFSSRRVEIRYDHIPVQLLQPPARFKAVSLDLAIRGKNVGYLPGAGDNVAESLEQMGYTVTQLTGADLTPERLKGLDAVVIGIRAFNTRTDLAPQMTNLFAYVEAGGNVIVQYNRPNGLQVDKLAPFDLRLSNDRVTDENAAVTFLAPDHPALNTPNKITNADFDGWVQERGVYFPNQWDEHFTPIIACSDPGEAPLKGGLLVAKYGKGYFVYTGLAWFRQLPAGVPGAYRLFANLVSLGK